MSLNLKHKVWDSLGILSGTTQVATPVTIVDELVRRTWGKSTLEELLWHEVCSEYDARHLLSFSIGSGSHMSADFARFTDLWLADENNHYVGFRYLYQKITGIKATELDHKVKNREISFDEIPFVTDEFTTCVLLAYDEMVTAKAYPLDYAIYDLLDQKPISQWIRLVCRDEIYHCVNVINILRKNHSRRLGEIPQLIELISKISHEAPYSGTFVLDYEGFPPELLTNAKSAVLKLLHR